MSVPIVSGDVFATYFALLKIAPIIFKCNNYILNRFPHMCNVYYILRVFLTTLYSLLLYSMHKYNKSVDIKFSAFDAFL